MVNITDTLAAASAIVLEYKLSLKVEASHNLQTYMGFPAAQLVTNPPAMLVAWLLPGSGRTPEGEATRSTIPAWKIPGTEEPSGLPSMGSHRVGHD